MTNSVYKTAAWLRVRKACLERDGHECQLRFEGCQGFAVAADHIMELEDGGPPYDLDNLQAVCGPCNSKKGSMAAKRRHGRRLRSW